MDVDYLVPLLALVTLLAVTIFALVSKIRVDQRRKNPAAPVSTLAADTPDSRG